MSYLGRLSTRAASPAGALQGIRPLVRSRSPIAEIDQRVGMSELATDAISFSEQQENAPGPPDPPIAPEEPLGPTTQSKATTPVKELPVPPAAVEAIAEGETSSKRAFPVEDRNDGNVAPDLIEAIPSPFGDAVDSIPFAESPTKLAETPTEISIATRQPDTKSSKAIRQENPSALNPESSRGSMREADKGTDIAVTPIFQPPQISEKYEVSSPVSERREARRIYAPPAESEPPTAPTLPEQDTSGPKVVIDELIVEVMPPKENRTAQQQPRQRADVRPAASRANAPVSLIGPLASSPSASVRFGLRYH